VVSYLSGGAPEGERNDTIYKVAQQFKAAGLLQSECEARVMPVAIGQGGERVRREVLQAIKNGFAATKVTKPIRGGASGAQLNRAPSRASGMATGEAAMKAALEAAFLPGERVAICQAQNADGDWKPGKAAIHTREGWLKRGFKPLDACPGGCYIAINPLKEGAARRTRDDIAVFRHVLVEWDAKHGGLSVEEQEKRLRAASFPVSVIVASGGSSVHGWVRVDAPDLATWEKRRDEVFAAMQCDPKNKDVSRVSRLPGFKRGEEEQRLLALNAGTAGSWADAKAAQLPARESLRDLLKAAPCAPPEIIKGVLYQGTKMMLGGPSKARKSWILLDLALSVATGARWVGFETVRGKVLYINFELQRFMLHDRIVKISAGKKLAGHAEDLERLHFWNLRGRIHDIAELTAPLTEELKNDGFTLVIIDPIYKGLGARDENAAGDINNLLNHLEDVCAKTGAAVCYAHHFSKGAASDKATLDRTSGSGVWVRDPDTVFTLTPPAAPKKGESKAKHDFEVDVTARAHARIEPFNVCWHGAHYEREGWRPQISVPREGSYAQRFGALLAKMPRLKHDFREPKRGVVAWIAENAGVSLEEAAKIFGTLRSGCYAFIEHEGDAVWVGAEFKAKQPF
jgi:RecA-family ATPase